MLQLALFSLVLGPVACFSLFRNHLEGSPGKNWTDGGSVDSEFDHGPEGGISEEDFSISALLGKANKDLEHRLSGLTVRELDIAVGDGLQNADLCTSRRCRWPKARDGKVYVPYRISRQYSRRERAVIEDGLRSFAECPVGRRPITCVRFIPRTTEPDFLDIVSDEGCYSFVGRQRGPQNVSLDRAGCVHKNIIQHELLHALGFHHEHSRSDRDMHVRILTQNIIPGDEDQFSKIQTNNLRTRYDYNSVMHYGRTFFSRNGQPTIVPIPDPNVPIGTATKMSRNDILRVNRLFNCYMCSTDSEYTRFTRFNRL